MTSAERIARAEQAIRDHGFELRYVDFCEDADTPGLLGAILGATSHERKLVKVATHRTNDSVLAAITAPRTPAELADVLEHELRHVEDPAWDCGNRDALGRGGPAKRLARKGASTC